MGFTPGSGVGSGVGSADGTASRPTPQWRLPAIIVLIGVAVTALTVWATDQVDDGTEQRLLERQTQQAAELLSSSIMVNQQLLRNTLAIQSATPGVDANLFVAALSDSVGTDKRFVSASLWQRQGDRMVRVVAQGAAPAMAVDAAATQTFLERALSTSMVTVTAVSTGSQRRIAYAFADPATGRVVSAERAIPRDGRSRLDSDPAFVDLNYANYLGPKPVRSALTTTNVDPATLPLTGITATERIPFGDTVLTLVTSPQDHLGAQLSHWLPLILLVSGLSSTFIVVALSRLLTRRRLAAEDSAAFASGMSERLQRALLPLTVPEVPQLDAAIKYVAGTSGVDIGGDWYNFVALDGNRFAFVIGDVSGKGIDAVAVMARARFTLRAYLMRGDSPDHVLSESSPQFDVGEDGHIATTIVGVGDWSTGRITVANAGHCPPLLLGESGPRFVDLATGPPLGVGRFTYLPTTFQLAPGDVLFCYTDGLIERRDEDIDVGMARLASTVTAEHGSVDALVEHAVDALRVREAPDDIAVLAFRWLGPSASITERR